MSRNQGRPNFGPDWWRPPACYLEGESIKRMKTGPITPVTDPVELRRIRKELGCLHLFDENGEIKKN